MQQKGCPKRGAEAVEPFNIINAVNIPIYLWEEVGDTWLKTEAHLSYVLLIQGCESSGP